MTFALFTIGFQELALIVVVPVVLILIAALVLRLGQRGDRE